jgi:hypothetical protein
MKIPLRRTREDDGTFGIFSGQKCPIDVPTSQPSSKRDGDSGTVFPADNSSRLIGLVNRRALMNQYHNALQN